MENEQIQSKSNDSCYDTDRLASNDISSLAAALAKAQGEFEIAGKSSANPFFKSKYADFTAIVNASRPALVKNGLSVVQSVYNTSANDNSYLITILLHSSGQWIMSKAKHNPAKNDVQSLSSYNTYLKRMCYSSLVGVITGDEDDDGNAASSSSHNTYRQTDKINATQLAVITNKIGEHLDIAVRLKNGYNVETLSDLPSDKFNFIIDRIDDIKRKEYGSGN